MRISQKMALEEKNRWNSYSFQSCISQQPKMEHLRSRRRGECVIRMRESLHCCALKSKRTVGLALEANSLFFSFFFFFLRVQRAPLRYKHESKCAIGEWTDFIVLRRIFVTLSSCLHPYIFTKPVVLKHYSHATWPVMRKGPTSNSRMAGVFESPLLKLLQWLMFPFQIILLEIIGIICRITIYFVTRWQWFQHFIILITAVQSW